MISGSNCQKIGQGSDSSIPSGSYGRFGACGTSLELNRTHETENQRFYELIWPQRAHVLRCAIFLTHKTGDAEDLAQETLLKAWRSLNDFELRSHGVRAWLLTILRNTWRDSLRSRKRHGGDMSLESLIDEPAQAETTSPFPPDLHSAADADALINDFSDQCVIDALRTVRDEYRWTLLLVDVSDLSYEQAAELLEVPVGTVRSRLYRGREILRDTLLRSGNAAQYGASS